METPKMIKDYFNPTDGIFSHMTFNFELVSASQLDILFFSSYGLKNPSPIVTHLLSEVPTDAELDALATHIQTLYSQKWSKYLAVTKLEYNPIYNYRDELTETINEVGLRDAQEDTSATNNRTNNISRDNTRTDNLSSTATKTGTSSLTSDTDDSIYGFNSSNANNSDSSLTTETGQNSSTNTEANTGTQLNELSENEVTVETKTATKTAEINDTNNKTRTSTHQGNIGNLTTQQLINQELELWKWKFTQTILEDVKNFLTIPIYLG